MANNPELHSEPYLRNTNHTLERWLSGRKQHTANVLTPKGVRGFESHPLRMENTSFHIGVIFSFLIPPAMFIFAETRLFAALPFFKADFYIPTILLMLVLILIGKLIKKQSFEIWHFLGGLTMLPFLGALGYLSFVGFISFYL